MTFTDFTGLRFLLQHGAFLQVQVPKHEAEQIIAGFIQDSLPPIVGSQQWSVRTHDVVAIHTVPVEKPQTPPTGPVWRGLSGILGSFS